MQLITFTLILGCLTLLAYTCSDGEAEFEGFCYSCPDGCDSCSASSDGDDLVITTCIDGGAPLPAYMYFVIIIILIVVCTVFSFLYVWIKRRMERKKEDQGQGIQPLTTQSPAPVLNQPTQQTNVQGQYKPDQNPYSSNQQGNVQGQYQPGQNPYLQYQQSHQLS